jgi:hypothetical protein
MKRAAIILCVLAGLAFQSAWHPVTRAEEYGPDSHAGQGEGCRAAVARFQRAVTAEAHAYADARRTMCQFMSLSADMREGRPQAINDSMQRNLREARGESAAAQRAASGCDTSGVKRPEVYQKSSVDAYISCVGVHQSCGGLTGAAYDSCLKREQAREEARARSCESVLAQADCQGLEVVEQDKPPEAEVETVVTPPADLNPECRDPYLQSVAAGRDYERAQKRVRELASTFGAAGPRGTAMYNAAREDLRRASEKKAEADRKLRACKALDGDAAHKECDFSGTYVNDAKTSTITISGGGSSPTAMEEWAAGGRRGTNHWSNCQVTGNTVKCDWTGDYRGDPAKSGDRHGTLVVTFSGNTMSGTYLEDTPDFKNPDGTPFTGYSAMQKGARWPINHTRKEGTLPPCEP